LTASPLLYPIAEKDYVSNEYIGSEWRTVQAVLENAYLVTVFGYAAPQSDKAAVDLMKQAWGAIESRNLEEFEFIDIVPQDTVIERWRDFVHTHHYRWTDDFYKSLAAYYPRRTGEAVWRTLMEVEWPHALEPFPVTSGFDELYEYLAPRINAEHRAV
jgi:hypothetical protein